MSNVSRNKKVETPAVEGESSECFFYFNAFKFVTLEGFFL